MTGELVYAIGALNPPMVKLGRTRTLTRRFAAIQSMSPVKLHVLWTHPGGAALESALHRHFDRFRTHGEWFNFGAHDPVQLIRAFIDELPAPAALARLTWWQDQDRRGGPRADYAADPCARCGHGAAGHLAAFPHPCNLYTGPDEWLNCRCTAYLNGEIS